MRNLLFVLLLLSASAMLGQYTQTDSLYIPPVVNAELVIGTLVEGDSVLVALVSNSLTESWIIFRRIGHDGVIGSQYNFTVPPYSTGGIYGRALQRTDDGGYFLAVSTAGDIQYFTGVLLKFTSDFQLEWQRNADHFESDYNYAFWNAIQQTNDNNLLAVGQYAWHPNPGPDDGALWGVALTKYTSSGDTLWTKVIDIGEPLYSINKIYELPNGELILTGIWDNVMTSKSVIYKVGANGEYWEKIMQGPNNLFGNTPTGFYHNGKFYTFFGAHQDEFANIPLDYQWYMAILDVETMTWDDQVVVDMDFDSQPTSYSEFMDIVPMGDGRAVLAFTEGSGANAIPDPILLVMADTTGNIIWERNIPTPDISDFYVQTLPSFLDQSSDGGYTINGYFTNMEISQAHWYVKTDPCGQVLPYACDPNGVEELAASHDVVVYPNPASNKIFITAEEEMRGIALYNMYGQLIEQLEYHQRRLQTEFDVTDLAPGLYTVQVEVQDGTIVTHKVIVE